MVEKKECWQRSTMCHLSTHSGSLETIPQDMEVRPSLTVTTVAPVFSAPTTSSRTISPMKKGVACKHKHTRNHDSAGLKTVKTCHFRALALLPTVVCSSNICLGRPAKSLQHFHVL